MAGWLLAPPLSVLSEPSLIQAGHCPRATFACPRSGGIVSACGRQLYPAPAAQGLSCTAGHLKRTSAMYAQPETWVARKLLVQTFFFFFSFLRPYVDIHGRMLGATPGYQNHSHREAGWSLHQNETRELDVLLLQLDVVLLKYHTRFLFTTHWMNSLPVHLSTCLRVCIVMRNTTSLKAAWGEKG